MSSGSERNSRAGAGRAPEPAPENRTPSPGGLSRTGSAAPGRRRFGASWLRIACLLPFLLLFETSCTRQVLPGQPPGASWQAHQERLAALYDWRLQGRIALRVEQTVHTLRLHWQQRGADFTLQFSGHLSQQAHELSQQAQGAVLRTPDGGEYRASDAEALLREHLGWGIPVYGIRYWLRGMPAPGLPVQELRVDDAGRTLRLRQGEWELQILEYMRQENLELPRKLLLVHARLRLKLVIHDWRIS